MAPDTPLPNDGQKPSRRDFIQHFTITAAVSGAATLLITSCTSPTPKATPQAGNSTQVDVDKHRAFLTLWLLLTTNRQWIDGECSSIDFDGISRDLGGHLPASDIKSVFDFASSADQTIDPPIKTNADLFRAVGGLFNQTAMKQISGYDAAFYTGKTCPTTMKEPMGLFTPAASLTLKDPKC